MRVYYSPAVMGWLRDGDRSRPIPDGAMIVKEQFAAPAARWQGKGDEVLRGAISSWTAMLRDSRGSRDGWYWADFAPPKSDGTPSLPTNPHAYPFVNLSAGVGQDCLRCHAAAAGQFTFAALANIDGRRSLTFRVDDSWRPGAEQTALEKLYPEAAALGEMTSSEGGLAHGLARMARRRERKIANPMVEADPEFLRFFDELAPVGRRDIRVIPNETYDHIVPGSRDRTAFFTSDQCMACHSGLADPFRSMFFRPDRPEVPLEYGSPVGVNVSPFGEWRWSMMGLAGRDPVFHAQVASELKLHGGQADAAARIASTCFSCHGVMGQRQFESDRGGDRALTEGGALQPGPPRAAFDPSFVTLTDPGHPDFKYGALRAKASVAWPATESRIPGSTRRAGRVSPIWSWRGSGSARATRYSGPTPTRRSSPCP